jgi:uncharacterized protein (TIGR00661 family)
MKILYGIQCTGNGHVTRSLKIISKLKNLGHEVDILLSGKNYNINLPFPVKWRFKGFTFFNTKNGGIDYLKTFVSFDLIDFFKNITIELSSYDKVITDFEPITAWACKLQNKKCYGISNQYSFISQNTPRDGKCFSGEKILKWMAPVDVAIGLHYKSYDDFIYQPIISDEILKLTPSDNGHYTVYLPSYGLYNTIKELSKFNNVFHIFNSDIKTMYIYKNCILYPIDKGSFANSFTNSHGIITNAGFQTSSEALYMSKKLMVIPVKGQYEQESNAKALSNLGIFTGKLEDIDNFLQTDKVMFDKWDDPSDKIISQILN